MDKRELVAFCLLFEDFGYERSQVDIALESWKDTWLPALQEEHCGDCTNVPMTCTRCAIEGYFKTADAILEKVEESG